MANMFRCVLASGGALILTVTCDSAFAGQTITCTDGTTTLTQICPSTSPYTVEFRIPNSGTWTISSGTSSTSVTIPSSAELHDIPNGSTITPTNVIQTWLHCANIWDKTYTTISQVLADSTTVTALIANNNAVDYMVRSTSWANSVTANASAMTKIGANDYCANKLLANSTWSTAICNSTYFESVLTTKVPTMTSDTTPSGQVIHSSASQYYTSYGAFDGNTSRAFGSADIGNHSGDYVGYKFTSAVLPRKFVGTQIGANGDQGSANLTYKIRGSNDGTNWTDLSNQATINGLQNISGIISTNTKYQYLELYVISGGGTNTRFLVYELQFYGR